MSDSIATQIRLKTLERANQRLLNNTDAELEEMWHANERIGSLNAEIDRLEIALGRERLKAKRLREVVDTQVAVLLSYGLRAVFCQACNATLPDEADDLGRLYCPECIKRLALDK